VVKKEEILRLEQLIKDAELRSGTFKIQIETIQKELDSLYTVEKQLEDNIKYLKRTKIVALASEYKKAKNDLKKTKLRLGFLKSDRTNNDKAYKDTINTLEKIKESYIKLTKENENNVLCGKFGKKSD
jgi:seryl-tRNA synthetase